MKLSLVFKNHRTVVLYSGGLLLAIVFAVLFNMSSGLNAADAEKRVRVVMTRAISEKLIQVNNDQPAGEEKNRKLNDLAEELKRLNALQFKSVNVRKLVPDILIRPHRPTHIVRVETKADSNQQSVRYFWLPWDGIDGESSSTAWFFSF